MIPGLANLGGKRQTQSETERNKEKMSIFGCLNDSESSSTVAIWSDQ